MFRSLIVLGVLTLSLAAVPTVEAGPLRRIAARVRQPFGGRGVPVLRRVNGRGVGQAGYSGGCANGQCR